MSNIPSPNKIDEPTPDLALDIPIGQIYNNCNTITDYIEVISNLDYQHLDALSDYYPIELQQLLQHTHNYPYREVYMTLALLFHDNEELTPNQIQLYSSRTRLAIRLLRWAGWDFDDARLQAELLGYYAIFRLATNSCKKEMLSIFLEETNGRTWINRPINTPSGNHSDTTLLVFLADINDSYIEKVPHDIFEIMFEYGANPNVYYENYKFRTPLALACKRPDSWLAQKLIDHGALADGEDMGDILTILSLSLETANRNINELIISQRTELDEYRACAITFLNSGVNIIFINPYCKVSDRTINDVNSYNFIDNIKISDLKYNEIKLCGSFFNCNDQLVYDAIYKRIIIEEIYMNNSARYIKWLILVLTILSDNIKTKTNIRIGNIERDNCVYIMNLYNKINELLIWKIIDMVHYTHI